MILQNIADVGRFNSDLQWTIFGTEGHFALIEYCFARYVRMRINLCLRPFHFWIIFSFCMSKCH